MGNFELIDNIDISNLKSKVKKYNQKQWNEFNFRQKTFDVHKKTQTIPLIYNENIDKTPIECDDFKNFEQEMYDVWKVLRSSYSYGSIVRAILVKLSKNSKIDRHIDGGKGLEDCIRHHIPIITNKKVLFTVDDETINMKAGEIWRIDNLNKYPSVVNNSKYDRVHLIVEWLSGKMLS